MDRSKSNNKKQSNEEKEITEKLMEVLGDELKRKLPTIGVIGVSGVGKSSTINAFFNTTLATSDTIACTKEFIRTDVDLIFSKQQLKRLPTKLRIIDAPGLGEDVDIDPQYLKQYRENLPECDVILWVLTARNRAIALDQLYLRELSDFHGKIVFGINQIELLEPLDWGLESNLPSMKQEENISIVVQDRKEKLSKIIGREANLIPYSAKKRYQLQILFTALLEACPEERRWIFQGLKAFKFDDFLSDEARKILFDEKENNGILKGFVKNSKDRLKKIF